MKKILLLGMIFVVMLTSVFAQGGNSEQVKAKLNGEEVDFSVPFGLEKAQVRVKSGNALEKLERNLERFREKHQERLQDCEEKCILVLDEDDEGNMKIKTTKRVRILGLFETDAVDELVADEEGTLLDRNRNFGQFMRDLGFASIEVSS